MLVFAEGRVGDIGPVPAVANLGLGRTRHDSVTASQGITVAAFRRNHLRLELILGHGRKGWFVGALERADHFPPTKPLGASAVVLKVEDESVVELVRSLEGFHDSADPLVHVVDHGSIDFHTGGFPLLELDVLPITYLWDYVPLVGQKAERLELLYPGLPGGGITSVIFAFILCDIMRKCVHGPVGRSVGDIHEKGLPVGLALVILDVADRIVRDGVCVVERVGLVVWVVVRSNVAVAPGE